MALGIHSASGSAGQRSTGLVPSSAGASSPSQHSLHQILSNQTFPGLGRRTAASVAAAALGVALLAGCVEVDPAPRTGLFRKPTGIDNLPSDAELFLPGGLPTGDAGSLAFSGGTRGPAVLAVTAGSILTLTNIGLVAPPGGLPAFSPDGSRLLVPRAGLSADRLTDDRVGGPLAHPEGAGSRRLRAWRFQDDFTLYAPQTANSAGPTKPGQQTADRAKRTVSESGDPVAGGQTVVSESAARLDAPIFGARLRSFGHWGRVRAGVEQAVETTGGPPGLGAQTEGGSKVCDGFLSTFAIDGAPPRPCVLTESGEARVVELGLAEGVGIEDWCVMRSGVAVVIASAAGESPTLWLCSGERSEPLFSQGFSQPSGYVRLVTDGAGTLVVALRAAQDQSAIRAMADVLDIPARRIAYTVDLGLVRPGMRVEDAADVWVSTLACDVVALRHFDDGRIWVHGASALQALRLPPQVKQISPVAPSDVMAKELANEAQRRGMLRVSAATSAGSQRWFIATGAGGCWFLRLSRTHDRTTLDAVVPLPSIGAVVCGLIATERGWDAVGAAGSGGGMAVAGVSGLRSTEARWDFGVVRPKKGE